MGAIVWRRGDAGQGSKNSNDSTTTNTNTYQATSQQRLPSEQPALLCPLGYQQSQPTAPSHTRPAQHHSHPNPHQQRNPGPYPHNAPPQRAAVTHPCPAAPATGAVDHPPRVGRLAAPTPSAAPAEDLRPPKRPRTLDGGPQAGTAAHAAKGAPSRVPAPVPGCTPSTAAVGHGAAAAGARGGTVVRAGSSGAAAAALHEGLLDYGYPPPAPSGAAGAIRRPWAPSAASARQQAATPAASGPSSWAAPEMTGPDPGQGSGSGAPRRQGPGQEGNTAAPRGRPAGGAGVRGAGGGPPANGAAVAAQRLQATEAAVEALRRQVAAKEAAVRAKKAQQAAREAEEHARKVAAQAEAEQRRAQLSRGLAALAEALGPEEGAGAAERTAQTVRVAGPEEVRRVLRAASDFDVLELQVGCTAAEVRKAYRRLAASLHPDKCGQEGAQEAFIRATAAYNALLKRSGG